MSRFCKMLMVSLLMAAATGACSDDSVSAGTWRFVSLEREGRVVLSGEPLFLETDDDGFVADTTCNSISGEFGGPLEMTAMGCVEEAHEHERAMADAFATGPIETDDELVFDTGAVRLVYERYDEPAPEELFAVLGDPGAGVDEAALPPESATGSVPPDFESLVPLPSPDDHVDLFLAELDGNVCVVYATPEAIDKWCRSPRHAESWTTVTAIPIYGEPIFRLALIPDTFATAAANRTDLGSYEANLLIVNADAPPGTHVLTNDAGETLQIEIPDQ